MNACWAVRCCCIIAGFTIISVSHCPTIARSGNTDSSDVAAVEGTCAAEAVGVRGHAR